MRWSHKYHKGFNRLLLVITCCPLVIMVFYILLSNRYKVPYHVTDERLIRLNPDWESDKKIGEWAQKEYQKRRNPDIGYGRDEALYSELLAEAKSLPESLYLTKEHLEGIIDLAVLRARLRRYKVPEARQRAMKHFAVVLSICVAVYGLGHVAFFIGVWIAKGFRHTK